MEHTKHHLSHVRSHLDYDRGRLDKAVDFMTLQYGSLWFLIFNAIFFLSWIEWNLGWFGLPVFDPFPFGLLTMIVSLEAIFLAIVVLISQNRQSKVGDIRQQLDFEVDFRAEAESKRSCKNSTTFTVTSPSLLQRNLVIKHLRSISSRSSERSSGIRIFDEGRQYPLRYGILIA